MTARDLVMAAGGSSSPVYVDDVFSTYLYTGNGSTQTINNGIDLAGEGGLVWIKARIVSSGNTVHQLTDTVRGVYTSSATYGGCLSTNDTSAANTSSHQISNFRSSGFTFADGMAADNNASGYKYVSWTFRKAPKFFDVQTVSHTNGTANTIDLSVLGTVGSVIAKITNTTGNWTVWHRSLTTGNNLQLNLTNAQSTTNAWLSVSGTTATLAAAAPTGAYVIYAFAHDIATDGKIQCGSYIGTGVSAGPTITLGWEPQLVMVKSATFSDVNTSWVIQDTMRGMPNSTTIAGQTIYADSSGQEFNHYALSPTSSGFTTADTGTGSNQSGATYIYIAIRRPNKPPTTGTQVFSAGSFPTGSSVVWPSNITADMVIPTQRDGSYAYYLNDRLRGGALLLNTTSTAAESGAGVAFDVQTGVRTTTSWYTNGGFAWMFKRAAGFFDIVCYTGTGMAQTVMHNLGVAPQIVIVKRREGSISGWLVWSSGIANTEKLYLNLANSKETDVSAWNSAFPTSTMFNIGTNTDCNANGGKYIAYLFSSLDGVSKVGSYSGNGISKNIECGFSTGARFILIKRIDSTGDWYMWDTVRGIVSANDPHMSLNSTAAEVTTDDSVDPYAAGFAVNQVSATNINVSGATYIFLAIA